MSVGRLQGLLCPPEFTPLTPSDDSGAIDFEEFKSVLQRNIASSGIPFNFDSDWIKLYLGRRGGSHVLGYHEFTQLIKGFQGERLRQAFHYFDKDADGYITPEDFQRIVIVSCEE